MKKILASLIVAVSLLSLAACENPAKNVDVIGADSELYTKSEIDAAADTVVKYFEDHFDGCVLTEMRYMGDDSAEVFAEWAEQYDAEQAIVLTSSFDVDASGGDGSLNPNTTYDGWQWILTRNADESWTLQTWGYG